jgi:hypothetical protein
MLGYLVATIPQDGLVFEIFEVPTTKVLLGALTPCHYVAGLSLGENTHGFALVP